MLTVRNLIIIVAFQTPVVKWKNPNVPTQSVSPPAHVMWAFMRGHLQHPASSVSFVKASELGGGQRGELEGQTQVCAPKALTTTPVHGLPLALLTVPWNGPQEQCKPPRNRPLTVSQQCSLCVKIVKAGPFLHRSCLSFEPQLWANKAGLKVCVMVS